MEPNVDLQYKDKNPTNHRIASSTVHDARTHTTAHITPITCVKSEVHLRHLSLVVSVQTTSHSSPDSN